MNPRVARIRDNAVPLDGSRTDYDPLLALVGDARIVLLGEASHGTHEFYRERARITQRLIAERGFRAVAVEADWPDADRVNAFVRGVTPDADAAEALGGFRRFPQWMWRNADVLDFVGWLRDFNDRLPPGRPKCGFYGLDLYSLHASIAAVIAYLERVDPPAAARARHHYACFDRFERNGQAYGWAAGFGMSPSCREEVVAELTALRKRQGDYLSRNGQVAADAQFCAEQNALVVRDAEQYYRLMVHRGELAWNQRDHHMRESLLALAAHLEKEGAPAPIVVWAHNSHVGDARATSMHDRGEINLGQLVREHCGAGVVSIGFTTHTGTVTAANGWDQPAERKVVRPSLPGSVEREFHDTGVPRFWLEFERHPDLAEQFRFPALERAIGVIYRPRTERVSHYFRTRLAGQFDGIIHIDRTRAVEPLERTGVWEAGEVEETYPSGL